MAQPVSHKEITTDESPLAREESTADAAFAEMYGHYYESLKRHAIALVRSSEVAEEIVQQSFANTYSALKRGTDIGRPSSWLHRCVRNLCFDQIRKPLSTAPLEDALDMASESGSPQRLIEVNDHWGEIESAVGALPSTQRAAFLMAEVRGLDYQEIAESMETSVESVRQLLFRARRKVRQAITYGAVPLAMLGLLIALIVSQGRQAPPEGNGTPTVTKQAPHQSRGGVGRKAGSVGGRNLSNESGSSASTLGVDRALVAGGGTSDDSADKGRSPASARQDSNDGDSTDRGRAQDDSDAETQTGDSSSQDSVPANESAPSSSQSSEESGSPAGSDPPGSLVQVVPMMGEGSLNQQKPGVPSGSCQLPCGPQVEMEATPVDTSLNTPVTGVSPVAGASPVTSVLPIKGPADEVSSDPAVDTATGPSVPADVAGAVDVASQATGIGSGADDAAGN